MSEQVRDVKLRSLRPTDEEAMSRYLAGLSEQTRRRFGPHAFDAATVRRLCASSVDGWLTYVAVDAADRIAAYAVVCRGCLPHEEPRFCGYGIRPQFETDYTLAPSVADAWQSRGLGDRLLRYVIDELRARDGRRVFLWGGVQAENVRARRFYQKHGFRHLGDFEHHGTNHDMVLLLNDRLMQQPDWLAHLIIYEVNPYAYTSRTRGAEERPESGTLAQLTERLPYISSTGVTAIWLAGFSEASDHHFKGITVVYACVRPDRIDPRLGTRAELQQLVRRAHELGLKVLLEVVTHGVVRDSSLTSSHPEWFAGGSWGMADYDYQHPGFREWWIQTWYDYAVGLDVDGFRLDGPNGVQTDGDVLQIWDEIVERCGRAGKAIVVMPENRAYHFQQGLQDTLYTRDPLAEFSDFPRFRCKAISNHDCNIDEPTGVSPYRLHGSRYVLAYEYLFAFNIPLLMAGEEFAAEYRPLPACRTGLFGDGQPCSWLYASWLDWRQLQSNPHAGFLEDFRRLTAVRHQNRDVVHYDRLRARACRVAVTTDRPEMPRPYLRYQQGGDAVLVVGNDREDAPLHVTLHLPLDTIWPSSPAEWRVTDLWSGESSLMSARQLQQWSIVVGPDRQSGGGVRLFRMSPRPIEHSRAPSAAGATETH